MSRAEVAAEDFYKPNKPVLCAAHMIGIADPAMYRHNSYKATELRNKELKEQHKAFCLAESTRYTTALDAENQRREQRWTLRSDGIPPSNEVGDLCNAQDALAYERAWFRADCAARAIRTIADAEKAMLRIAVARPEGQEKYMRGM